MLVRTGPVWVVESCTHTEHNECHYRARQKDEPRLSKGGDFWPGRSMVAEGIRIPHFNSAPKCRYSADLRQQTNRISLTGRFVHYHDEGRPSQMVESRIPSIPQVVGCTQKRRPQARSARRTRASC